jgi:Na+/H+-dicarboxylate symporter
VLLASVLTSVGIPVESVALIIGVDRILDMSRTAVNVAGDLTACVVMDRWVGGTLSSEEEQLREDERQAQRAAVGVDVLVEPSPTT